MRANLFSRILPVFLLPLLLLAFPLSADEVFLNNGRVLSGTVIEQTDSKVVIDVPAGRLSLPMSMIERVEAGESEVSEYQRRAQAIPDGDADRWVALGFWAQDERLDTRSKEAFERALSIEPGKIVAREVLGLLDANDGAVSSVAWERRGRASRSSLDALWDGMALAPGDEALAQRLDEALSLARHGLWAESAWRLRQARDSEGASVEQPLYDSVLFAVDLAANSSNEAIESLFTPRESELFRVGCVVSLKFEQTQPPPWEFAGDLHSSTEVVDLSGGRQLSVVLPFRRAGQKLHLASTERLDVPILFEGRWMEVPSGGSLLTTWRTDAAERVERDESQAQLEIRAEADGVSWGEVRSEWRGGVANYRKHQDLDEGFFTEQRFIRAKVESERINFDVEGGFTESLAMPASPRMFLDLQGGGERSSFDWISIAGPIDGLWLARRLAIRAFDE